MEVCVASRGPSLLCAAVSMRVRRLSNQVDRSPALLRGVGRTGVVRLSEGGDSVDCGGGRGVEREKRVRRRELRARRVECVA